MPFKLIMTALGTCNAGNAVRVKGFPVHNHESYNYIRDLGFNAVCFGYLDNWDPHFSQFDFYGNSNTFDDLIPRDYRKKNRAELSRRLRIAADAGLSAYISTEGPISRKLLFEGPPVRSVPDGFWQPGHEKYEPYFGTGGDRYGGGRPALCLGHKAVRDYYRELITDIVSSFPTIAGFTFFGGDSYSTMCDDTCSVCGAKPAWQRYVQWVEELASAGQEKNPDLKFYIRNWPWWKQCFDMIEIIKNKSVGFITTPSWGFKFGETGEEYPKLTKNWWCLDPQGGTMPIDTGELKGSVTCLSQPWANVIPPSDTYHRLAKTAKERGLPFICWDERVTAEAIWPYHLPSPLTPIRKLRHIIDSDIEGIEEFWGLTREELTGQRANINSLAFKAFLKDPSKSEREILSGLAAQVYGERAVQPAVEAWHDVLNAFNRWTVIAWRQRMQVMVRGGMNPFYMLDLTNTQAIEELSEADYRALTRGMWAKYAENLETVISHLDAAIAAYGRVAATAKAGPLAENARFDTLCLKLGRNVLSSSRFTCFAHTARIDGKEIPGEILLAAIGELKTFLKLNEEIDMYIVEIPLYLEAIRSMEARAAG